MLPKLTCSCPPNKMKYEIVSYFPPTLLLGTGSTIFLLGQGEQVVLKGGGWEALYRFSAKLLSWPGFHRNEVGPLQRPQLRRVRWVKFPDCLLRRRQGASQILFIPVLSPPTRLYLRSNLDSRKFQSFSKLKFRSRCGLCGNCWSSSFHHRRTLKQLFYDKPVDNKKR